MSIEDHLTQLIQMFGTLRSEVSERLDRIEKRLDRIETRLDRIEVRLDVQRDQLGKTIEDVEILKRLRQ
ncbi:hypothetical protein [Effusibacillus pohliae]|uniref:hypothetical protein n=1 Tax=Effusibacillus pohliae TaxID=232270 RepID=UPI000373A3E7|nr:hypothetical protein [Effusibacillus pohliae]